MDNRQSEAPSGELGAGSKTGQTQFSVPIIPQGQLSDKHLDMLRASAISDETILARGYRTITDAKELGELGFSPVQRRAPGLLLPLHTTDGDCLEIVFRPDNPRVKRKGKKLADGTYHTYVVKYETAKGQSIRLDCPPTCRPDLDNPKIPLWLTEGQKKADSLASVGLCSIALLGVWGYVGRNAYGGTTWLPDWRHVALKGRDVFIVYDSDAWQKPSVGAALRDLTKLLQNKGAHVQIVYLPAGAGGKVGVDDWLAEGHTRDDLEALVEAPRPEIDAAAPTVELLDDSPLTMSRPLSLIDGRAYAATWLHYRATYTERKNDQGEIVKLDPPVVQTEQALFILRDDGQVFTDVPDPLAKPLAELGFDVHLPEIPKPDKLWSGAGVKRFVAGQRPDPRDVSGACVTLSTVSLTSIDLWPHKKP